MTRVRAGALLVVFLVVGAWASPAFAQYVGGSPPAAGSSANPVVVQQGGSARPAGATVSVLKVAEVPRAPSGGLALTGAEVLQLLGLGALCTTVGLAAVRAGRRRSASVS